MKGPVVQIIDGSGCVLKADYRATLFNDAVLRIRQGFAFDGASIPRMFWRLVGHPFEMPLLAAATCHDALYSAELYERDECDRIFLELMRRAGISRVKRYAVWAGVRAGGWRVWNRHTSYSKEKARRYCSVEVVA